MSADDAVEIELSRAYKSFQCANLIPRHSSEFFGAHLDSDLLSVCRLPFGVRAQDVSLSPAKALEIRQARMSSDLDAVFLASPNRLLHDLSNL